MPTEVSGLNPSTLGWGGKYSNNVLQSLANKLTNNPLYFLNSRTTIVAGNKPPTLGWWGQYSVSVLLPLASKLAYFYLNIPLPMSAVGLNSNPQTLDDEVSVWLPYYSCCTPSLFCSFQCPQWWLDLNPQPLDDEASVLPLFYNWWTTSSPMFF